MGSNGIEPTFLKLSSWSPEAFSLELIRARIILHK